MMEKVSKVRAPKPARWCIWWLDQSSWEVANGTGFIEQLPSYIREAFESRGGRAGRGRLWPALNVAPDMADIGQMELWGSGDWGGIVFPHRDRAKLAFAPGFVTDLNGHFTAHLTNARDYGLRAP